MYAFLGCYLAVQLPLKLLPGACNVTSFSPCTDWSHKLRDLQHFMSEQIDLHVFEVITAASCVDLSLSMLLRCGHHILRTTSMPLKLYREEQPARFVFNNYSTYASVSNMIANLGWNSLHNRRNELRLIMLFKIVHKLVDIDAHDLLVLRPSNHATRGHHLRFFKVPTRVNAFLYSFFHPQLNFGMLSQIV